MTNPFDPPFTDAECEQLLLGLLILKNNLMAEVEVISEMFYFDFHQQLFAEMKRLFSENKKFDIPDLNRWADKQLENESLPDNCPPKIYIRQLWENQMLISTNCADWCFRIADLHRKRCISDSIDKARWMLDRSESGAVLAELHKAISDNSNTPAVQTQAQVHARIREGLRLPPNRYPTGFARLDAAMGGGLYAGFTYGIGGEEKAGKTTLAHSISYQLETKHVYCAMEMGSLQIEQRNMARHVGINSLSFLSNAAGTEETIRDVPAGPYVHYLDCPGASVDELLYNVSGAVIKHGCTGAIVDYWQLIGGRQRGDSEEYHLRDAAQRIANFGRKHGVWFILLAQLGKGGDLFGGNGLKKACDQLFFIEPADIEECRFLKMEATRYTPKVDVGTASAPGLGIDFRRGPYFYDPEDNKLKV